MQCLNVDDVIPILSPAVYCGFDRCGSQRFVLVALPYSAYISRVFNFANFEMLAKLIQLKFEPLGYMHVQVHMVWLLTTAKGKGSRGFSRSLAQISSSPIDIVQISLYPWTTASTSKEDTVWRRPALMRQHVYAHALSSNNGRGKLGNTHTRNIFNELLQNSNSRKFRPAKYNCYTVVV